MNQPPLNPDALAEAIETIGLLNMAVVDPAIIGKLAIETYLAANQPVVNNVEELDALTVGSVVRGGKADLVAEKVSHSPYMPHWFETGEEDEPRKCDLLPARVLYRPEVES